MTRQETDLFLVSHQGAFPPEMVPQIYDMLLRTPLDQNIMLRSLDFKNPTVALILSLFLGYLGVDRFYTGDIGMGVIKLLTGGGCGVWTVIDWFLIMSATRRKNYEMLLRACPR